MAQSTKSDTKALAQQQRHERLAAELRANLKKRKRQARDRAQQQAPEGAEGEGGPDTAGEGPADPAADPMAGRT